MLAPWLLLATSLLLLDRVPGEEKSPGVAQEQCCFRKSVGDVTYTLIRINKVRSKSCKSRCIYEKDNDKLKLFCFSKGALATKCLQSTNHTEFCHTNSDTFSTSLSTDHILPTPVQSSTAYKPPLASTLSATQQSISTLIDELNKVRNNSETKMIELESTTSAAKNIAFYLDELKTMQVMPLKINRPERTISCDNISTNLREVRLMLIDGSDAYNISKSLEVTKALSEINISDLGCSEEEITSIDSEVKAAKESVSIVLEILTKAANSLSGALAQLCQVCNNQPSSPSLNSQSSPSPLTSVSTPSVSNDILEGQDNDIT